MKIRSLVIPLIACAGIMTLGEFDLRLFAKAAPENRVVGCTCSSPQGIGISRAAGGRIFCTPYDCWYTP